MDENIYDEIFEGWLRTPDLTNEMPWMLRHSLENFQEMRLMEDEKGQEEFAHTPFKPVRRSCSLQELPSHSEELESGSDTISIPQDCLTENQNSPLSTPSSSKKWTRRESATSEMPISAVLPLPCNADLETKVPKPGQDLPAKTEGPQPDFADWMISQQDSRYNGPWMFISTPSLGIMLQSARKTSFAPSSSHRDSFFGYPDSTGSALPFDGELEEKVIEPDAPTFRLQELPSVCLQEFISTPSLGIRLGVTKAPSFSRSPPLGVLSPGHVPENLSQCINNIISGETKDSSCYDICDCTSKKDDNPEIPLIDVVKPSNASESASFHEVSRTEDPSKVQNLPQKCDGTVTGRVIDENAQQPAKHDGSPFRRHDALAREPYQQCPTETPRGSNAVHHDQPAQHDPTCNPAHIHGTNTPPPTVDTVHDSSKELSRRRPKKLLRRVPVASSGQGEKVVINDSRVKMSASSTSPFRPKCVDSGATQAQAHGGKSGGDFTARRHQSSNATLKDQIKATTSPEIDIGTDAGTGTGTGTGTSTGKDVGARSGNGTGVGGGSFPQHRSEVGATRAETVPALAGPSRNRSDRGYRNQNRNRDRPVSNQRPTRAGHGWPADKSGFQPSSRNYNGPNLTSAAHIPASRDLPIACPPTSSAPQLNQSVPLKPTSSSEVGRLEPRTDPRRVSVANLNCDPVPAAAVQSTATAVTSDSAHTMSVDTSGPADARAIGGISATNLNAQVSNLVPYGRRVGMSNLYASNHALAMASYNAGSHVTSSAAAGTWRTKQTPYTAHEDDMIRPVGNWDSSADDAAHVPVPGEYKSRIDLRKVRQITKLTERFHPRSQTSPQGLACAVPVQMAGVPVNDRTPNGANASKSPPSSPAKLAVAKPQDATPSPHAATESPEQAKLSVPPHLRPPIIPATPKLLLKKKLPAPKSALKPIPSTNGHLENSDVHTAKQVDVPAIEQATAKPNPVDEGATCPSLRSQRKTPSDRSLADSVGRRSPSPKVEKITKVAFGESNAPPVDASNHPAKTDGVPPEVNNKKVPNVEPRHPLIGWDGAWQEAPVDWSDRPLFNTQDKHRLRAINTWMEERAQEALINPVTVDTRAPGFETGEALAVGEKELQKPINRRVHETHLPDDDFTHAKKDGTAAEALEKHQARIRVVERDARAAERESKADRRAYREAVREAAAKYVPPPNPHTPRANIYIRPAILEDMAKIAELYNHYIAHSVVASERSPMTAQQWQTRWEDAREAKYAFLVAVQSSPRGGGYSRRTSEEVLTGFAYADDYGDRNGAWRFTCEIQFFVAHWQLRAGVGKSLVDRLLTALDPVYIPRNGVQFSGAGNSLQYEQGGERVVSKIVIGIPFAVKEDADVKWQKEWLAQFGFEEMATFPKVGRKLGKEISLLWLHRETGSILSNGM